MRSFLPGKTLPPGVVSQIKKRQDVLGLTGTRLGDVTGPESFAYYHQKVPWVRLVSSISKDGDDGSLAKTNILSNGILEGHNNNTPAGYEISPTLGPRPKPGITSMDLKTHNRFGSLRTATVNFTVFSVEDLDIYERLFMSPGYTALLEWGHSKALTPDGEVEDVQPLDLEEVFEEDLTISKVFGKIQEHRKRYSYNYDASFGLVKNFSWSLNADGSYSCSTDIVSIGTAFESMNISSGIFAEDIQEFLEDEVLASEGETTVLDTEETGFWIFTNTEQYLKQVTEEELGDIRKFAKTVAAATGDSIPVIIKNNTKERKIVKDGDDVKTISDPDLLPIYPELVRETIISADLKSRKVVIAKVRLSLNDDKEKLNAVKKQGQGTPTPDDGFYKPNIFLEDDGITPKKFGITVGDRQGSVTFEERVSNVYYYNRYEYRAATRVREGDTGLRQILTGTYIITIAEYTLESLETEELPATTSQNVPQVDISDFLGVLKKYHPQLRSRIHFLIDQLLVEARNEAFAFSKGGTNANNLYKEFTSNYLLERLRDLLYPKSPQERTTLARYSTTTLKYITVDQVDTSSQEGQENRPDLNYQYIQLGAFLEILNHFILRDQNKTPIFAFDTSVKEAGGKVVRDFKTLDNFHCSVDVSKCLLPRTELPKVHSEKRPVDAITGILLEKQYLYGVLESNMLKGEIKFYDLIQTILDDITRVTGKVNDFQLQYYENFRTFRIVDRNFTDIPEDPYPNIEIFGKNTFVKNVQLSSRLTPEMTSQIAIAAQADPSSSSIEGSAWRLFNTGLIDRVTPEKKDAATKARESIKDTDELEQLQRQFANVIEYLFIVYGKAQSRADVGEFAEAVQKLGILPPNIFSDYKDFCNYQLNREVTKKESPKANNFIIPYELNLTVDGLSGLEVMSAFVTNDALIPPRYKGNGGIGFIITGLQHKVTSQGWDTTINSQIFNLDRGKRKSNEGTFKLEEASQTTDTTSSTETLYNPVRDKISTPTQEQVFARKVNQVLPSENEAIKVGVVFLARQEQNFQGFNYNYYGVMADIGPWTGGDRFFNGSFASTEGSAGQGVRTKQIRYFASFESEEDGIRFIANQLKNKKWNNVTEDTITSKYYRTWLSPADPDKLINKDEGRKKRLWVEAFNLIRSNLT